MLVLGVFVDFVTFRTISIQSTFVLLLIYWLIAGATITYIQWQKTKNQQIFQKTLEKYYNVFSPLVIQFTFGALLSASLIFYWFSGILSISWPIIFLIAFLMIANEAFRAQYLRPVVQISVYYFVTFSLFSLILPYVFNSISPWIFLLSGILSLAIMSVFVAFILLRYSHIKERAHKITVAIVGIFVFMNVMYFSNLIPPIPLSLIDAGVYQSISRFKDDYVAREEAHTIFEKIVPGMTVHITAGSSLAVFSSIFAPFDFETQIVHEWQYFDGVHNKWVTVDKLPFSLYGGRENGYRGYSTKYNLYEGLWRVNVQTNRGQILGRVRFRIKVVETTPELIEIKK